MSKRVRSVPDPRGPKDPSLLVLQQHHRSELVDPDNVTLPLRAKRCGSLAWPDEGLHPRVQLLLHEVGFYGVYKGGYYKIDHALITALVERWRPETHTFHLTVGEATITLQDVSILWELPIDGIPVSRQPDTPSKWQDWVSIIRDLLGIEVKETDFPRVDYLYTRVIVKALMIPFPENPTDLQILFRARQTIFIMLAGIIFADTSGNKAYLPYLWHLRDWDKIRTYSWGSAALAYLYKELCHCSSASRLTIAGSLTLLQLWAWERMPTLRPVQRTPRDRVMHKLEALYDMPPKPRASRWDTIFSTRETSMHVLRVYRDTLDRMDESHFVWTPYENLDDVDADYNRPSGHHLWRASIPLIFFRRIEPHRPERVMRQFGLFQHIPSNPQPPTSYLHISVKDPCSYEMLEGYIQMWYDWPNYMVHAQAWDGKMSYTDEYMVWFRRVSRLYIGNDSQSREPDGYMATAIDRINLGAGLQTMYHGIKYILARGDIGNESLRADLESLRIVGERTLRHANLSRLLEAPVAIDTNGADPTSTKDHMVNEYEGGGRCNPHQPTTWKPTPSESRNAPLGNNVSTFSCNTSLQNGVVIKEEKL